MIGRGFLYRCIHNANWVHHGLNWKKNNSCYITISCFFLRLTLKLSLFQVKTVLNIYCSFESWILQSPDLKNISSTISDVKECRNNPCHQNATCTDTIGSFECECNEGFNGTGVVCEGKIRAKTTNLIKRKIIVVQTIFRQWGDK